MLKKIKRWLGKAISDWSAPLIIGVLAALVFANIAPHAYHELIETPFLAGLNLHFLSNDVVMTLFFGLAAKEITEATLPGGDLNPPKKALNPIMGTIGGVVGPIGVYLLMATFLGAQQITKGWGIPTATDIALAWLVARIVFGAKHPAVKYLLLLAVADDAIGLGIIAIAYPDPVHPVKPIWLLLVVLAMGIAFLMRRRDIGARKEGKNEDERGAYWKYLVIPGLLSWGALHQAHLHPALALVPIVPFMPASKKDEGMFDTEEHHKKDCLNRFEHFFKPPVDVGLLIFGFANAGVAFSTIGPATWAVLVALVVGKTIGITLFGGIAHRFGATLPEGMTVGTLVMAGFIASLGLTVALFVSGAAFTDPILQGAAKMGALASGLVAFAAIGLGRALRIKRIEENEKKEVRLSVVEPTSAKDAKSAA